MSLHVINLPEPTHSAGPPWGEESWERGGEVRRGSEEVKEREDTLEESWADSSGGRLKSR